MHSRQWQRWFGIVSVVMMVFWCFPQGVYGQTGEVFRMGFTQKLFLDVNPNDVGAVSRVLVQTFLKEGKIDTYSEPIVFESISEIRDALSGRKVEALELTASEFAQVRDLIADDIILCGVRSDSITEEYLLIVNKSSNIEALKDLKGRSIGMLSSVLASLAGDWLDTLLLRDGLERSSGFFGQIVADPKAGNLLIPLFFGKLDACVVTRKVFDTMVELNPQTGKKLKILDASPPVVPVVFCFRKSYTSPLREQVIDWATRTHLSSAGMQSLMVFQLDRMEQQPISRLDSALKLLSEYQKLLGGEPVAN